MKGFLICCFVFASMLANTELKFDSFEYWQDRLKNKDLRYGYYPYRTMLIIVNKHQKDMQVFSYEAGELSKKFSQVIITGKNGDKMREGDLKTPVGVYDIAKRFVPKDQFYGPLAFSLSYPNLLDKVAKKTGGGIWIHGYPMDGKRDNDLTTRGCVAIKNTLLLEFGNIVDNHAVVLISEQIDTQATNDEIALIFSSIFRWQIAWQSNDIKEYLEFYSKDFINYNGENFEKFKTTKERIFSKNEKKEIKFSNLSVTPYPNVKDLKIFRVIFDEEYSAPSHQFRGKKELYVRLDGSKIQIIAEN